MGMAIGAAAVEVLDGTERLRLCWVAAAVVAVIANARHPNLQQLRIVAAVGFVTVGAVFEHWRVLPQEWAAPLGVTAQAILISGALDELLGIRRAVRIMATGAGDFPFTIRHVRGALQLRAAHLVTLQAQLRLPELHTLIVRKGLAVARIGRDADVHALLDLVAVRAGDAPRFVRTAFPEHVRAARVAIHANGVLLGHGVFRILAEANRDGLFTAAGFHVGAARSVASFATAGFLGSVGIAQHYFAHYGVLEAAVLIVMAGDAGVAADVVAVRRLRQRCFGLFLGSCGLGRRGFRIRKIFSLAGTHRIMARLLAG